MKVNSVRILIKKSPPPDFDSSNISSSTDFQLHPNMEVTWKNDRLLERHIFHQVCTIRAVDMPLKEEECGEAAGHGRCEEGRSILRPPRGTALRTPVSTKVQLLPYLVQKVVSEIPVIFFLSSLLSHPLKRKSKKSHIQLFV